MDHVGSGWSAGRPWSAQRFQEAEQAQAILGQPDAGRCWRRQDSRPDRRPCGKCCFSSRFRTSHDKTRVPSLQRTPFSSSSPSLSLSLSRFSPRSLIVLRLSPQHKGITAETFVARLKSLGRVGEDSQALVPIVKVSAGWWCGELEWGLMLWHSESNSESETVRYRAGSGDDESKTTVSLSLSDLFCVCRADGRRPTATSCVWLHFVCCATTGREENLLFSNSKFCHFHFRLGWSATGERNSVIA